MFILIGNMSQYINTEVSHTTLKCSLYYWISGKFPYAKCFICGETGHLSKQCPDNPKGLYPMGKKNSSKYSCNIAYFRKRIDEFLKGEIRIEDN